MAFKEGDRIRMKASCSGCAEGLVYRLALHNGMLMTQGPEFPRIACSCYNLWELVPKTATEIIAGSLGENWYSYSYPNYIYTTEEFNCKFGQTKPKSMIQKITATLKRILSPSLQSQYKAGFRNGDLALTQEGKNELLEILAAAHEKELTDRADIIIEEAKEE